jgi:hypothetical protein
MFRCYTEDEDGGYTAWFGYNNLNDHNVYITASGENYISGAMTTAMPPTVCTWYSTMSRANKILTRNKN